MAPPGKKPKAVVLLSGGLDSATTLAMAREQGYETYAITFAYGQRHKAELEAAKRVAQAMAPAAHQIVNIDLAAFGGSALTDTSIPVPKSRSATEMGNGIPVTYVPARNTIFLSFALAWAEVLGAYDLFIGVNALDYSGYPDCRPQYISAFQNLANLATAGGAQGKGKFTIHAPLLALTKAQIVRSGMALGVDYSLTLSCYDPDAAGHACGACDACQLRQKGFREVGVNDPAMAG
jgi:7-cyano-7-deazaguanine synthase